jgi:hypothetical protein
MIENPGDVFLQLGVPVIAWPLRASAASAVSFPVLAAFLWPGRQSLHDGRIWSKQA